MTLSSILQVDNETPDLNYLSELRSIALDIGMNPVQTSFENT